jgi:hypothetical protein
MPRTSPAASRVAKKAHNECGLGQSRAHGLRAQAFERVRALLRMSGVGGEDPQDAPKK